MGFMSNRRVWFYGKRALWILIIWMLISNALFLYDYITLRTEGALDSNYDFMSGFEANLIVGISAGLIGGLITVNLMEYWLRKYAFWQALFLIVIVYSVAAFAIAGFAAMYLESENLELPMFNSEVIEEVGFMYTSWLFLKNFIIWLIIVVGTLIVLMVSDKYGPGVFLDYLLGRYFRPKKERRIFMFADIRNATGIAEQLGEERYFHFLKDFFKDITPAIVQTRGDIYQYVGDEVVVSWKMKRGLHNGNALQCFYSMKKLIASKESKYQKKYQTSPEFKVGYHFGPVMVGELGQIKREIAFSGDVLNTTARIQSRCNSYQVDILASKDFADIAYQLPKGITRHNLGEEKLRGKLDEIGLVTFRNEN